jgi:photosystem II stability/assembly factor-like uncharacterized protein
MKSLKVIFFFLIFFIASFSLDAQWNNIYQFTTPMNGIWFVNENTGYVCGGYNTAKLMKTTSGGYTWEDITPVEFTGPVYAITFLNPSKGFISWRDNNWSNTYLDRTQDAGMTWTVQYNTVPYINTICFPTSQVGYTFPSAMEYIDVVKTIDGGETWQRILFYTAPMPVGGVKDCSFPEESTGYLVTGYGSVYKTTDGGFSLSRVYDNSEYYLSSITFPSTDTGFATGFSKDCMSMENCGLLLKTTDGGITWEEQIFNDDCYDICFPSGDTGYLASSAYPSPYGIYKTVDKGNTWLPDTCNYYSSVSKIHFAGTDIGYALASIAGGTALMKRDPDIGVSTPGDIKRVTFNVFPVPAKKDLTISINFPEQSLTRIDLINQQGMVIGNIWNGKLSAGNHLLHQDISLIADGLYFCRIQSQVGMMMKKILIAK